MNVGLFGLSPLFSFFVLIWIFGICAQSVVTGSTTTGTASPHKFENISLQNKMTTETLECQVEDKQGHEEIEKKSVE